MFKNFNDLIQKDQILHFHKLEVLSIQFYRIIKHPCLLDEIALYINIYQIIKATINNMIDFIEHQIGYLTCGQKEIINNLQ